MIKKEKEINNIVSFEAKSNLTCFNEISSYYCI